MGLGSEIKAALKERHMTIKELAEKTGISVNTLYAITKRDSSNVNPDIIMKIAKELDMDLSMFLASQKLGKVLELFTGAGREYISMINKADPANEYIRIVNKNSSETDVLLDDANRNLSSKTLDERMHYFFNSLDDSEKEIVVEIIAEFSQLNEEGLLKIQEQVYKFVLNDKYKKYRK